MFGDAGGLYVSSYLPAIRFHGKSGMNLTCDGMQVNNFPGTGGSTTYAVNRAIVEETAVETGAYQHLQSDTTWLYTNTAGCRVTI